MGKTYAVLMQDEPDVIAYTRLWQKVILQAIEDSLSRSNATNEIFARYQSRQWLEDASKDFHIVCGLACLSPEEIKEKAHKAIAQGARVRIEKGKAANYLQKKAYRLRYKK